SGQQNSHTEADRAEVRQVANTASCTGLPLRYNPRNMLRIAVAVLLTLSLQAQNYYSVPPIDAPELAPRGPHSAGVPTVPFGHRGQPDILHFDKDSNQAPLYDRPLTVEIWYPATIPTGAREHTEYESAMPGNPAPDVPKTFRFAGKALRDAPPKTGAAFPLVIV